MFLVDHFLVSTMVPDEYFRQMTSHRSPRNVHAFVQVFIACACDDSLMCMVYVVCIYAAIFMYLKLDDHSLMFSFISQIISFLIFQLFSF